MISRRAFLRAAGAVLPLPFLEAMAQDDAPPPRRMVLVGRPLGLYAGHLIPEKSGPDYDATRYLKIFEPLRGSFTLVSGISHLGYPNEHHTSVALFTGASPHGVRSARDLRNSVSLDVVAAEQVGRRTRFPSLVLGGHATPSVNRQGVVNPAIARATAAFKQLFVQGTPEEVTREMRRLEDGRSILDGVRDQLKALSGRVGSADRERIESFTGALREAEQRLEQDQAWVTRPKPKVDHQPREFGEYSIVERQRQWYDIVRLALQTDSTRVVLLAHGEGGKAVIPGLTLEHHDASHHGQDERKVSQLAIIEEAELTAFADFLQGLEKVRENGRSLLQSTQVLLASNLSNASGHITDNLPTLLCGGGYRHQGHLAFDRKRNRPLSNLYLRMLHHLGVEAPSFGCSTAPLSELS